MTDSRLLADMREIVESGEVAPVDGITAAGQPDLAAFEVFAKCGYTTVIDMRGPLEDRGLDEPAVVASLGMDYVPFPFTTAEDLSFENAKRLNGLIRHANGPVLVHCTTSNRVGALLALCKSLDGADAEAAMAYGVNAGLSSLVGAVAEALSNH